MLGFCKPPYTVPKCHPLPSSLSRILEIPCLYAFAFVPVFRRDPVDKEFPCVAGLNFDGIHIRRGIVPEFTKVRDIMCVCYFVGK